MGHEPPSTRFQQRDFSKQSLPSFQSPLHTTRRYQTKRGSSLPIAAFNRKTVNSWRRLETSPQRTSQTRVFLCAIYAHLGPRKPKSTCAKVFAQQRILKVARYSLEHMKHVQHTFQKPSLGPHSLHMFPACHVANLYLRTETKASHAQKHQVSMILTELIQSR